MRALASTTLAFLLVLGSAAAAQDTVPTQAAMHLARDSRVAGQALVAARGELWRQVRMTPRTERDIQFARYQCISALDDGVLIETFARVFAAQLDAAALRELAGFYGRREIVEMMGRRVGSLLQHHGLPDLQRPTADEPTRDQITGRGRLAFAAMQDSPAQKAFEQASQAAYAGPVRAALANSQDRCRPASKPPPEPLVRGTLVRPVRIAYPPMARHYGVQGLLEVVVQVRADGKPVQAVVAARWLNLPERELAQGRGAAAAAAINAAAVQTVMGSLFEPPVKDGQAVETSLRLPINFFVR